MSSADADLLGVLDTLRATPRAVRYLLGGMLINQVGAFVQTFLVLFLVEKGFSTGQAGLALGAYSLGAVVGTLVGGELTHRVGPRGTIAGAMATSAALVASVPSLATPGRFPAVLVVVTAAGAATQAYRPAASALLSDLMPGPHRVMAFSMMRIALNVGAALGPLLAALLILVDWNLLFWVDGVTAFAYALLAVFLLPRPQPAVEAGGAGGARAPGEAAGPGYGAMLTDVRFLVYLASMALSALVYIQFFTTLPLKIAAEDRPTALYSAALALSSIVLVTCELAVTSRVRRWPPSVAGGLGTTLFGLGLALFAAPGSAAVVLAGTVVFVTGLMIGGPTVWAHPAKAPAAIKGRYIGASQAVFGLGSAAGPALGVLAWQTVGNGVWLLCAVLGAVAGACAVVGLAEDWETTPATPAAGGRPDAGQRRRP
jgi:MFS family permease